MVELILRVTLSLAVVLGLFLLVARFSQRRLNGGNRSLVRVVGRQALGRSSSLAVVEVGERVLVVGVSDSGVRLLTEMDPAELELPETETSEAPTDAPTRRVLGRPTRRLDGFRATRRADSADAPGLSAVNAVTGSLLSAQTWKQAWAVATSRQATQEAVDEQSPAPTPASTPVSTPVSTPAPTPAPTPARSSARKSAPKPVATQGTSS